MLFSLAPGPGAGRDEALDRAAGLLRRGGVVAFATDTYYALGADPLNAEAVARVLRIKQRGPEVPLPVLVSGPDQADQVLGCRIPPELRPLVDSCWPGPLTLVLPASRMLPPGVTGPGGTVGLRWPAWTAAEDLLRRFGGPITGSSANRSGEGAAIRAGDVFSRLGSDVDMVLDSGDAPGGGESTVVRWERSGPSAQMQIIREGRITLDQVLKLTGLPAFRGPAR